MTVRLTTRDGLAIITLDRPAALNALSFEIIRQISDAIDKVAAMSVRALIITGEGPKAFCAGADIKELLGRDMATQHRDVRFGQTTFAKLESLPVASIAAINGYAFGGGLELALACTFRVAASTARMGLPEIKLGLIPGYGGTQRLPRAVGEGRALEMIMTGRAIGAEEALRIGLVQEVADGDVVDAAIQFAGRFTAYSLPVLRMAREAVLRAGDTTLSEGLRIEADLATLAFQTADAAEGMDAFANKRQAGFRDA
jgi:enoyl-CoA hydratase